MSKIQNLPKSVFLQIDPENESPEDFNELAEVIWHKERINDTDIEYILKPKKKRFVPPTLTEWINYFVESGYKKDVAELAWRGYNVANWYDSQGKKIKNWKQKALHVWFKDINKERSVDQNKWINERINELKQMDNER